MPTGLGRGSNPNGPTLSCDAAARENERFRVDFVVCCMGISLSVPLIGKLIGFHGRILAEICATKYSDK
jgi:phosphoribosyl 1,2-cyclic phosphodiesterase